MCAALIQITRVFSNLFWHLLFFLIFGICFLIPVSQTSDPVPASRKHTTFDKANDPTYFTWGSDLHTANHFPGAVANLKKFLELSENLYHPDNVIFTGDLVDNYEQSETPTDSYNNETQWKLYSDIRNASAIPNTDFFEVLGNHDTWGILSLDGKENYPDKYTMQPMLRPVVTKEVKNVRLIAFTPEKPPIGKGTHLFFPKLYTEFTDALEEELNKPTTAESTLILTHYNTYSLYPQQASSKGTDFIDMISSEKVTGYLAGHTHPDFFEKWHHKGGIELIAPALKYNEITGIVAVDNGRLTLNAFTLSNPKKAILTSPVDDSIASRVESSNDIVIRVISFDPSTTLTFTVSGDVTGTLAFERNLKTNVNLYSLDAHLENGHHKIHISGAEELDCEFSIGVDTKTYEESQTLFFRPFSLIVDIVLFLFLNITIGVGMFLPFSFLDEWNKWLYKEEGEPHYILSIVAGPLLLGNRLKHLHIILRIVFAFFILWPLCLPAVFFHVENVVGISWIYGHMLDGDNNGDVINLLCTGLYETGALSAFLIMMSLYEAELKWSMLADTIYSAGIFIAGSYVIWRYGSEIAPYAEILASFAFFIIPIFFIGILVFFIVKRIITDKNQEKVNGIELSEQNV